MSRYFHISAFVLAVSAGLSGSARAQMNMADASKWVNTALTQSGFDAKQGHLDFTVVLFTGHFGRDPAYAEGTRSLALGVLQRVGARGDTVHVVGAELKPWLTRPEIVLQGDARDTYVTFPTTPAPASKGGRDIERTLLDIIRSTKTAGNRVILAFSPGPSQLASDGSGSLLGEGADELTKSIETAGLTAPKRSSFRIDGSTRHVWLTLLTSRKMVSGGDLRKPLIVNSATGGKTEIPQLRAVALSVPGAPQPRPEIRVVGTNPWVANLGWIISLALAGGLGVLWRTRPVAPKTTKTEIGSATVAPAMPFMDASDDALDAWRTEAKRQQRGLDNASQEIYDAIGALSNALNPLRQEALDAGGLRRQIAERDAALAAWDDTAMDYLDDVQRALELPGLSDERKQSWEKAAKDFARRCTKNGLDVIQPSVGDPIIEGIHRVEGSAPGSAGHIVACIAWGYRRGNNVLRSSRVIIGDGTLAGETHA